MCPPANITNTGSVLLIRSRLVSGESSGRRIIGKTRDRSACRTRFCPYSCSTVYKSITFIFRVIKPCPFTRKKSVAKKNRLMDISRCLFPTERTLRSAARHAAGARVQFTWNVAESNDRRMIRIIFYYWLFLFFFPMWFKVSFPSSSSVEEDENIFPAWTYKSLVELFIPPGLRGMRASVRSRF